MKIIFRFGFFTILIMILLVLTFSGCQYSPGGTTATVVPNLSVTGIPSNVTAITLTVSGPGMNPIVVNYSPPPSSISVEVPAGADRQFELIAYVSDQSAALSFIGTATADLAPGVSKEIVLNMGLNETKLIMSDYWNNRLIQIDDISGTGWVAKIGADFGFPGTFAPYDIDFDSLGRIYFANNWGGTGISTVSRIDNMNATSYTFIAEDTGFVGIRSLAIDRPNDLIYYSTSNELYRWDIGGSIRTQINIAGIIGIIRGLAVDENGILYIAGENTTLSPRIFKYNPTTQIFTAYGPTNLATPWDVVVNQNYLYVANLGGANGWKIIRLDLDLNPSSSQGFGNSIPPVIPGNFYGPHRFVAILNRKLNIIDEDENDGFNAGERIVAFDDINGANWETFDPAVIGQQFIFYSSC